MRIPADEHEVEMIVEVLRKLASDPQLRADAGHAALDYVLKNNSMVDMVDGYREALKEAYGIDLARLECIPYEPPLRLAEPEKREPSSDPTIQSVASAISELGLGQSAAALTAVGSAITELGLDMPRPPVRVCSPKRLVERIACPVCGGKIDPSRNCVVCGIGIATIGNAIDLR